MMFERKTQRARLSATKHHFVRVCEEATKGRDRQREIGRFLLLLVLAPWLDR